MRSVFSPGVRPLLLHVQVGRPRPHFLVDPVREAGRPHRLQTDKGSEFLNKAVQKFLHDENVEHFTSENETINGTNAK